MNRILSVFAGPEVILALFTAAVFAFCARHSSYSSADVRVLERLMWLLPLLVVTVGFATLAVPGARTWWWLGRINFAVLAGLTACALRVVEGFGAPGSGPKGQDAGLILVLAIGVFFSAIGNAIAGTLILRAQNVAFDDWYRMRPYLGPVLTAVATVPLVLAQIVANGIVLGVAGAIYSGFKR